MKVRSGWNSDYAHRKYDVELDEVDLARILLQLGLPVDSPTEQEAFDILSSSAEIYARRKLIVFDPSMKEDLEKEIAALDQTRRAAMVAIKKRHG